MRTLLASLVLLIVLALPGCVPKHPVKTARPVISSPPWEERAVRSAATGAEYRYLFAAGPGADAPALLLLHGAFVDNRVWLNVAGLAARFNVYTPSWPDDSPFYDGTFAAFGNAASDFLGALGLKRVFVAGVSMGCYAAIELIAGHPDIEAPGLVLVSATMLAIDKKEIEGRRRVSKIALDLQPERLRALVEWQEGRTRLIDPPSGPHGHDIFWVRPYSYYRQVFGAVGHDADKPQPTERIACPVLLLSGTADKSMPIELVRRGPARFPRAAAVELLEVPGQDHGMVFSDGPLVVAEVLAFFARHGLLSGE